MSEYKNKLQVPRERKTDTTIDSLSDYLQREKSEFESRFRRRIEYNTSTTDFEMLHTLGSGSFGRVVLAKRKQSGNYYAIKIMVKKTIMKTRQLEHTRNEKRILEVIYFPFVVHLEYFFQDNSYIYLCMPLILGGELFVYLRKSGKFPESQARFYAAQVILGLEYLHYLDLAYRDLKPENILIDQNGYLKITDFGFCKIVRGRTYTLCGTPEYLAPEVILSKGYGKSVDYWSYGVLIYEMCAGYPPFYAKDHLKLYEKIVSGKYRLSSSFTPELCDILQNILQTDLSKRYGNLRNGVNDIKEHKWFRPIEWGQLLNRKLSPVYVPHVTSPSDVSNFHFSKSEPLRVSDMDRFAREFADF